MFLYKIFITMFYYLIKPFLFLKFRKKEWKERTVRSKFLSLDNVIWIHAASLGEVNAVKPLILYCIENWSKYNYVITTTSKTGQEAAKKISDKLVTYILPFDIPKFMKRIFTLIKPKVILIAETELWPCMLIEANKQKIPVIILNGRISLKSYPTYKRLGFFWKPLFSKLALVNAQSEDDKERYIKLGCKNVANSLNLKFSIKLPSHNKAELRRAWEYQFNDFILTFGSTRPGEEKLIREIGSDLVKEIPRLKIIITPRHLQRLYEVKNIFSQDDFCVFSERKETHTYMIIDEMGILTQAYALSDIAIIGGSFFNFGGHNPLEATYYKIPTIMGPYHQSCKDTVDKLKSNNGIVLSNTKLLKEDILDLYHNIEKRLQIGQNGLDTMKHDEHSLDMHIESLKKFL